MSGEPASLDRARAVKGVLVQRLGGHPALAGVGVAPDGGGWAVKVNLRVAAPELALPDELDGVRVLTEVVGRIVAREA